MKTVGNLRVNFRPFSFFTCTTHAKINPDDDDDDDELCNQPVKQLCVLDILLLSSYYL